jgi:hypothetical protein
MVGELFTAAFVCGGDTHRVRQGRVVVVVDVMMEGG